jgi:hypothetical protein
MNSQAAGMLASLMAAQKHQQEQLLDVRQN